MKTFKQFIFESEKPKEYEVISNSHGAHATIDKHTKKPKKEYEVISNSHGAHASKSTKLKEERLRLHPHPSFEEHFLPKISSKKESDAYDKGIGKSMDTLHKNYMHSDEGRKQLKQFTEGSAGITSDLVKHHTNNRPLIHKKQIDNLDKHGFISARHKFDTYSGVGFNIKNAKPAGKSKQGNLVYHQPTYLSSSIDKHVAGEFGLQAAKRNKSKDVHILHWHHNEGNPIGVIGKHSEYPHEHEVLIPRTETTENRHHIEHIGTDKYRDDNGNTVHVHHVKRILESQITKDPNEKV
jgi:hypothetical protein